LPHPPAAVGDCVAFRCTANCRHGFRVTNLRPPRRAPAGVSGWRSLTQIVGASFNRAGRCVENRRSEKWRNKPSAKVVEVGALWFESPWGNQGRLTERAFMP
jgi:hypothetical protein